MQCIIFTKLCNAFAIIVVLMLFTRTVIARCCDTFLTQFLSKHLPHVGFSGPLCW